MPDWKGSRSKSDLAGVESSLSTLMAAAGTRDGLGGLGNHVRQARCEASTSVHAACISEDVLNPQGRAREPGTYRSSWGSNRTHLSHGPRAAGRPLQTGNGEGG